MPLYEKINNPESVWGELYEPVERKVQSLKGLRVVIFGSATGGERVLNSLVRFEKNYPNLLNIVGVATDDPVDPKARISLKKRIWSNYSSDECRMQLNQIINASMNAGIPCYTGKVKTDYFRRIFTSWNPDVLIMNCFGQKLDAFLYEYPLLGAFNFHPSNLACSIGIGAQPFQEIMLRGLDTTPMVVHVVSEIIDAGPIVGISPEISIRLQDGSYPLSLITLLEKINCISGWMTIDLLLHILEHRSNGFGSDLTTIDFDEKIPEDIKQLLLAPVTNDLCERYELPLHPKLT
jgi:hypothetical protein